MFVNHPLLRSLQQPLLFNHYILWFGLVIIASFVLFSANYQQKSMLGWQISSQKSYCQEQQQNRLQRFSQFNNELMNYAIGARNNPSLSTTQGYLAHRNILRFILFSGSYSYSIKQHWERKTANTSQNSNTNENEEEDKLQIKDLIFWMGRQMYSLDIKQPMYFLDSPFKNLLVVVPLRIPITSETVNPDHKEIAVFEIEREALAIAMGESQICSYGIWNHKGDALFNNKLGDIPLLLSSYGSVKGETWVDGLLGKDLIMFEQHPSSVLIAHKLSLQNLYQNQGEYFKNVLFYLGILCFFWCFILSLISASISRPLRRFRQALIQISKGKFRSIPRLFLKGEMGLMERTIIEMSEKLQKEKRSKTSLKKN